jgi:hypothetical protein
MRPKAHSILEKGIVSLQQGLPDVVCGMAVIEMIEVEISQAESRQLGLNVTRFKVFLFDQVSANDSQRLTL